MDLVASRLRAQRLSGRPFGGIVDAVRHFAAVQAQDYAGAKWALGLRVKGVTEAAVDAAYDAGVIVRTHVLRPTWHFVLPEDLRWMLALSGPKIEQGMASRHRQLELDAPTIDRALDAFGRALAGGRHLTRPELGRALEEAGIPPGGQRMPHLLIVAELRGVITSGARKGKQLSFALVDERVPRSRALDREEAIAELTRRYFAAHGPAQVRDLTWWSGLTQAEVKRGLAAAKDALQRREIDGAGYWFDARVRAHAGAPGDAHLLPNFDEYTVGYADRSAILHPERPFRPELFAFSSILSNVVVIGGQVHGAWRRVMGARAFRVEVRPLAQLSAGERASIEAAAARFSAFLGRPVDLAWL